MDKQYEQAGERPDAVGSGKIGALNCGRYRQEQKNMMLNTGIDGIQKDCNVSGKIPKTLANSSAWNLCVVTFLDKKWRSLKRT